MKVYHRDGLSCLKDRGRYARRLGRTLRPDNKAVSKRFVLSHNEATARFQAARLEALWLWVCDQYEAERARRRRIESDALLRGDRRGFDWDDLPDEPVWNARFDPLAEYADQVADAIRKEETEILYNAPPIYEGPHQLVPATDMDLPATDMDWARQVHQLNQTFGPFGVQFVARDPDAVHRGQNHFARVADRRAHQAATAASIADTSVRQGPSMSTHEAADRYIGMLMGEPETQHVRREINRIKRIKEAIPDTPLRDYNYDAVQELGAYWRKRPPSRAHAANGEPMAITTVVNFMKTTRRMLDWWDMSDAIPWDAPKRWQRALKLNTKAIMTEQERLNHDRGPATWTIDELTTLYKIGTDWERALLLMQINLGYAQSEVESWRWADTHLDDDPPQVRRNRRKTSGYFEAALWPETVKAVQWLGQRSGDSTWVVLNAKGERATSSKLAAAWNKLLKRAAEYQPGFRQLPFKVGRKTAFTLVEQASTREIAGIFEGRGQVTTDKFADAYGPRLFDRVRDANLRVAEVMAPVFEAAPDAFTSPWSGGSNNIPRQKIELIQALWRDGASATKIAKATRVSRQTAYRHRPEPESAAIH